MPLCSESGTFSSLGVGNLNPNPFVRTIPSSFPQTLGGLLFQSESARSRTSGRSLSKSILNILSGWECSAWRTQENFRTSWDVSGREHPCIFPYRWSNPKRVLESWNATVELCRKEVDDFGIHKRHSVKICEFQVTEDHFGSRVGESVFAVFRFYSQNLPVILLACVPISLHLLCQECCCCWWDTERSQLWFLPTLWPVAVWSGHSTVLYADCKILVAWCSPINDDEGVRSPWPSSEANGCGVIYIIDLNWWTNKRLGLQRFNVQQ